MFQPPAFRVDDPQRQHALIRQHALGLLVASVDDSLEAGHIPVLLDTGSDRGDTLRFHLSRGNALVDALDGEREVLFVFQGPQSYVSPDWYHSDGMVPTWNYAVVHAYGRPFAVDDDALVQILSDLSADQEGHLDKPPWTLDKLEDDAFAHMRRAIVGFHMPVDRLLGKWKMGQNRSVDDRAGVVAALSALGTEHATQTAQVMAELLAEEARRGGS